MKDHQLTTAQQREGIVSDYLAGRKLRQIEEDWNVPRATVYWVLQKEGVAPDRAQRNRRLIGDDKLLAQLYEVIEGQQQQVTQLRETLEEVAVVLRDSISTEVEQINHGRSVAEWEALLSRIERGLE